MRIPLGDRVAFVSGRVGAAEFAQIVNFNGNRTFGGYSAGVASSALGPILPTDGVTFSEAAVAGGQLVATFAAPFGLLVQIAEPLSIGSRGDVQVATGDLGTFWAVPLALEVTLATPRWDLVLTAGIAGYLNGPAYGDFRVGSLEGRWRF